ncbi:MAG: alpha-glucan family phosphorylase [Candidatus Altiarchaeales archaeon]|nr:alpha-glucan family phosphorylase [Candidatus Altiarchaeales archaeon]
MDNLPEDREDRIAYFSMEVGLDKRIPTYCGGLGILAGDTLKSCADLKVPVVGVTLLNEKGFFYQRLDEGGNQMEHEVEWNPPDYMTCLENKVTVPVGGKQVSVRAWLYNIVGVTGYKVPVLFLDTNLAENDVGERQITWYLYGGDEGNKLKQEIVLGIGGVRMLNELGFGVRKYHMNEGHSSLLVLELLNQNIKGNQNKLDSHVVDKVRDKCVFTTHTPIPAGHDKFPYSLVEYLLGDYMSLELIKKYGGGECLNMTLLGFNLSEYINGVAKKHGEISRSMFPGYAINSITNGVHPPTWITESFQRLYDKHIADWRRDPFLFRYGVGIPDGQIWAAHMESKRDLIDYINRQYNRGLVYKTLTVGFARRMTEYKRPTLIFDDIGRLKEIVEKSGGIQLVFAGKAHPQDHRGKELIKEIVSYVDGLGDDVKLVYIENYNMGIAKKLVGGVDLWLNTPQKPREASGTSGMKAVLNGVLNFSVLDGWWIEGHIEGITGWSIGGLEAGKDSHRRCVEDLYCKLAQIMDLFYKDRESWINMMKNSISLNASFFNSQRMVQQYMTNAYWD